VSMQPMLEKLETGLNRLAGGKTSNDNFNELSREVTGEVHGWLDDVVN
jgi:hypothetical protein